jgi:hypothetical protein
MPSCDRGQYEGCKTSTIADERIAGLRAPQCYAVRDPLPPLGHMSMDAYKDSKPAKVDDGRPDDRPRRGSKHQAQ